MTMTGTTTPEAARAAMVARLHDGRPRLDPRVAEAMQQRAP